MSQDFEFNKEGFKLSYQRYLSDGVTGLMFISFFIIAFIKKWQLPVVGDKWLTIFPNPVGTEVQIAFLIFLFLIAPSIGITLTALSWFLLGAPSIWLIWIWHKFPKLTLGFPINYFVVGTNRSYDAKKMFGFFNVDNSTPFSIQAEETPEELAQQEHFAKITTIENLERMDSPENLYDIANKFEHLLIFYFPIYYASQIGYVKGLSRFLRTTAFLLFLLAVYFGVVHYDFYLGFLCLLSSFFFLLFTSLNEYHQSVKMLFMVYSLVMHKFMETSPKSREEIVQVLAETETKN